VAAEAWTQGAGIDGAIITASAKQDSIIHQATQACRKRGRIILVGVVNMNMARSDFYEKELSFQVSCSYGPGRYDDAYEQGGHDYPVGYVRWTEQRNFEAVLQAMRKGALQVGELITDRFSLTDANAAYDKIQNAPDTLGVILQYGEQIDRSPVVKVSQPQVISAGAPVVGVIGAGGFAKRILLPALAKTGARLAYVADLNPTAAEHAASKKRGGDDSRARQSCSGNVYSR